MEEGVYTIITHRGDTYIVISTHGVNIAIRPHGIEDLVVALRNAVIYNQAKNEPEFKSEFRVEGVNRGRSG